MTTWSETARVMRTQTVSSLVLLRAQPVTPLSQGEEWNKPCVIAGYGIIPDRFNPPAGSVDTGVPTDLQFEDERVARPRKDRASALQEISQTVRTLCSLTSDPKMVCSSSFQPDPDPRFLLRSNKNCPYICLGCSQVSQEFLQLVFQLRDLTRPRLRTLWEEASFKCRNDWFVFSVPS